jgi:hypothetical protein
MREAQCKIAASRHREEIAEVARQTSQKFRIE